MPLTAKGEEIMSSMKEQYGAEKGEEVFYASANKGTITGVHADALPETSEKNPTLPPPVKPMIPVAGYTGAGTPPPRDSGGFTLPDTVSFDEIKSASRKYGGW